MELFRLFGSIIIDDQDAIKTLKDTENKAKESKEALSKMGETGKKIGAAVAVGVGAATVALGGMIANTLETTGAIQDSADRAGMSAEEYQKWAYAASQCGMEASTLESAMIKQQKIFAEAKTGSETAGAAYAKLGIDISSIGSSSEAFDQVMAKMAGMTDESERNALANDIFGKSYAELTPLLNEGGAGMDALKQQASDLGMVMSNEAVSSGEALGDNLDTLKGSFNAIFLEIGTSLLPKIQEFADWLIANMPAIQEKASSALGMVRDAFQWVTDKANILIPILAGVLGGFVAFQIVSAISAAFTVLTGVITAVSTAGGILNAILAVNPLVLIALAIAAVIAAGVLLVMNWDKVKKKAGEVWDGIKAAFGGVGKFFTDIWDNVSQTFTKIGSTIGDAIGGAFKTVVNTIIGFAESKINGFIGAINGAIGLINKIPGVNIKELSELKIPRMAKGGVVTSPTFAQIGEDGAEAVMPLEKNTGWIDNLAMKINSKGSGRTDELLEIIISMLSNSKIEWNDRELGRMVRNYV